MTLEDWSGSISAKDLHFHLSELPSRKLHLLTAAFLRRVWDDLPSELTRTAVAATERFADGRISAHDLARLRGADLLDSCEGLWLIPGDSGPEEQMIGIGYDCPCCERNAVEFECRVVAGGALPGVRSAVDDPAWMAVRAALHAREIAAWKAEPEDRATADTEEGRAQFAVIREVLGPGWPDARWPRWRTSDVRALARGVHRDQAFDRLPILADALQDAGCDDDGVLNHCRSAGEHLRGCWCVDLAMGIG